MEPSAVRERKIAAPVFLYGGEILVVPHQLGNTEPSKLLLVLEQILRQGNFFP